MAITHLAAPADRRQAARDADTERFAALVVARDTNGDKP
jgi:hypothetical protein